VPSDQPVLVTGVNGSVALPIAKALTRGKEVWGVARFADAHEDLDLRAETHRFLDKYRRASLPSV